MSTTLPKTRNSRAPRKTAKAAAEKSALNLDLIASKEVTDATAALVSQESAAYAATKLPVHQRWSDIFAVLSKGRKVELRSLARIEAWEWFRSKSNATKVTMTDRSVGLLVAGTIVSQCGDVLVGIRKGGRK